MNPIQIAAISQEIFGVKYTHLEISEFQYSGSLQFHAKVLLNNISQGVLTQFKC